MGHRKAGSEAKILITINRFCVNCVNRFKARESRESDFDPNWSN